MPRKKSDFFNVFLNEYIFDALHNVRNEQRKGLSKATLRIISTSTRAKNFSVYSSIGEKIKVLTELGIEWGFILMPNGFKSVNELKQFLAKVNQGMANEGVKHLVNNKIFITTDKQTAFSLGLAAQTISHTNYFLNLDLLKAGHYLKKWSKRANSKDNDEAIEVEGYCDVIDNLIHNSIATMEYAEGLLGITKNEFRILLYLSINKHLYVAKDKITSNFFGILKSAAITTALKKLFYGNYIRKHIEASPIKYTITASGIELVARFRNRVLSNIN